MNTTDVQPPARIETGRLLLRRWRPADAAQLTPILDVSVEHLRQWIPWAVAAPAPLPEIEARLAGYADDFDAGRRWLYGIFSPRDGAEPVLLGGIGIYPRDATRRVPGAEADRVELGYWLRADATGRGYATEATRALLGAALALPFATCAEIRCDPRNDASAAVPRRLGFRHVRTIAEDGDASVTMVWEYRGAAAGVA